MITKGNSRNLRIANITLMMRTIFSSKEISRAEISEKLGLTRSTISTLTQEMLEKGLIVEADSENDSTPRGGRKRINLKVNPELGCILGIYILSKEFKYVLTDLTGRIIFSGGGQKSTNGGNFKENVIEIFESAKSEAQGANHRIAGVSIALPGVVDSEKMLIRDSEELGLTDYDFKTEISADLTLPVLLMNDVRACGSGQLFLNDDVRGEDFIYVFSRMRKKYGIAYQVVSTAIIIHGTIYRGHENKAGEFPKWYREKMFGRVFGNKMKSAGGRGLAFDVLNEVQFILDYLDPDKVYLGAGVADKKDGIEEMLHSSRGESDGRTGAVFHLSGLAEYQDYEVSVGAAFSYLQKLYTIPQIGDEESGRFNFLSVIE